MTVERARETLGHQVAAGVHKMLAVRNKMAGELSGPVYPTDSILNARSDGSDITLRKLADIAFDLGCEWEVRLQPLEYDGRSAKLIAAVQPLIEQSALWPTGPDFPDSYPVVLTNKGYEYSVTTLGDLRRVLAAAKEVCG